MENVLGWYHSHPGYGCWLSGIDVGTQMTNQQYQEPFVAIVVSELVFVCDRIYISSQCYLCLRLELSFRYSLSSSMHQHQGMTIPNAWILALSFHYVII